MPTSQAPNDLSTEGIKMKYIRNFWCNTKTPLYTSQYAPAQPNVPLYFEY